MKILLVLASLVFVLQESIGAPMGYGALPPLQVRSAVFANKLGCPITVEVTFESKNTESHVVDAGKSVNVDREINHGTWTATDPITSFKVTSSSNGEKVVPVTANGVEIHRYEIGAGAANGIQIQKTVM